ncbi:MAG: hypothetical protein LQ350_007481 [Teloschistes chrysophthalmus]|nr:MAG: hypothetical protein LQ350_007481 [Niorma chrysophthalma]
MSANAAPISLDRFAEAIAELPVGNLHAKAAELRNSIAHLVSSNEQLQQYAVDGDQDCADAIRENNEVVERMQSRISLLRNEVEGRGLPWDHHQTSTMNGNLEDQTANSQDDMAEKNFAFPEANPSSSQPRTNGGGSLGDEELARRLGERLDENMQDENDGIHL